MWTHNLTNGNIYGVCVFDGNCTLCRRSVELAQLLKARCEFVSSQGLWEAELYVGALTGFDRARCEREVVFIDHHDHVSGGAEAVARVLASSAWLSVRVLASVLGSRPVLPLAQWVYAVVARNRSRIPVRGYCRT